MLNKSNYLCNFDVINNLRLTKLKNHSLQFKNLSFNGINFILCIGNMHQFNFIFKNEIYSFFPKYYFEVAIIQIFYDYLLLFQFPLINICKIPLLKCINSLHKNFLFEETADFVKVIINETLLKKCISYHPSLAKCWLHYTLEGKEDYFFWKEFFNSCYNFMTNSNNKKFYDFMNYYKESKQDKKRTSYEKFIMKNNIQVYAGKNKEKYFSRTSSIHKKLDKDFIIRKRHFLIFNKNRKRKINIMSLGFKKFILLFSQY
ncbi:hypothetical protein (nucleomorph) [Guillardia theta]|uniref:Uncharacterized protein n=1 Tax=Guillardia theta TaxID=55529 RepID=Q98S77_GUITH|nr:hypothetical protein GTHECHR3061 [Guillardia theta]AAK39705.1 hypothetical protein [Guillardia theta]|mmetsp:Transcript_37432/g.117986  ORF Transcript_37432/g.117986 Transcript_37432/m.117986 type:complete len:259 (-) Transcript_37432:715-1491(-)